MTIQSALKCCTHQIHVTEAVEPEGMQSGGDGVELIALKAFITLYYCTVKSRTDPSVYPRHRKGLRQE